MRLRHLMRRVAILATLASSIAVGASTVPASATAPASTSSAVVVQPCAGKPQVRPTTFTISCGDGNSYLTKLKWTSWGATTAKATGIYTVNNCEPYCAAGKFISSHATLTLSKPKTLKTQRFFTNLHVGYVSGPKFKSFNFRAIDLILEHRVEAADRGRSGG